MKTATFILFLLSLNSYALTLSCDHPQTCNLLKNSTTDDVKIDYLLGIKGDAHDYRPKSSEVKKLIDAKYLVLSPYQIAPWSKSISKKRKHGTLRLKAQKNELSHFWFFKSEACFQFDKLKKWATKEGLSKYILNDCPFNDINTKVNLKDRVIILSHSALVAFFKGNAKKTFSLATGDHHHEISSKKVKDLIKIQKEYPSVTWVFEKQIHTPHKIKSMVRKSDIVINIDTLGSYNEKIGPLEILINKLVNN